jgi:hypothetical protein
VPGLPPRHFWTWKFQTGEGQAKVAAWFAGYPHGAKAAHEDGAGNFQQIQVSHIIEMEYSPEFQAGKCPECKPNYFPGELFEVLPEGVPTEIAPDPAPVPRAPPVIDPTSQVPRINGWGSEAMVRIPSPDSAPIQPAVPLPNSPPDAGYVVPASALLPVP